MLPKAVECLRRSHFVDEMPVDVEQDTAAGQLLDDVRIPNLVEESSGHRPLFYVPGTDVVLEDAHRAGIQLAGWIEDRLGALHVVKRCGMADLEVFCA